MIPVKPNDDGIRPAGKQDECFYCHSKVGELHKDDCVMLHKRVKLKITMDIEVEVPHSWDGDNIEFHRNEGSWCADNIVGDIEKHIEYCEKHNESCLCNTMEVEYLETVDNTPIIEGNGDERAGPSKRKSQ